MVFKSYLFTVVLYKANLAVPLQTVRSDRSTRQCLHALGESLSHLAQEHGQVVGLVVLGLEIGDLDWRLSVLDCT